MIHGANDNDTHCPSGSWNKEPICATTARLTTAGSPTTARSRCGYPRSKQEEQANRGTWPWLPGSIVEQCAPDEWFVCVEVRELAVLGTRAPSPPPTPSPENSARPAKRSTAPAALRTSVAEFRSEERRVGEEGRSRWS